jgi:hypothetical protein
VESVPFDLSIGFAQRFDDLIASNLGIEIDNLIETHPFREALEEHANGKTRPGQDGRTAQDTRIGNYKGGPHQTSSVAWFPALSA